MDKKGVASLRPGRKEPWALKSTAILKPNPKIPVIPNNTSHKKIRSALAEKLRSSVDQIKEESRAELASRQKLKKPPTLAERSFDLWGEEVAAAPAPELDSKKLAWLSDQNVDPKRFQGTAVGSSNRSKKILSRMKPEPSVYAPVEVPHPGEILFLLELSCPRTPDRPCSPLSASGAAYRPAPEDQQELMGKVQTGRNWGMGEGGGKESEEERQSRRKGGRRTKKKKKNG